MTTSHRRGRLRRAVTAAAVSAAAAAATLTVSTGPAHADSSFTTLLYPKINPFLTVQIPNGAGPFADVGLGNWSDSYNQSWLFSPTGIYHTYIIENQQSFECLTTDGIAGHPVYQAPCNGALNQSWITNLTTGDSEPRSIHSVSSGLYLDIPRSLATAYTTLEVWYSNGNDNQFFYGDG